MKAKFILFLFIFLLCLSCKKKKKEIQHQYPEDPQATTLTPRERLAATWKVSRFTLAGK